MSRATTRGVLRALAIAGAASGLAACTTPMHVHTVKVDLPPGGSGAVAVAVLDRRPDVVSGSLRPKHVGDIRGDLIPRKATLASGLDLAEALTQALTRNLSRAGYDAWAVPLAAEDTLDSAGKKLAQVEAGRRLLLTVSHFYCFENIWTRNISFEYAGVVTTFDESGAVVSSHPVQARYARNLMTTTIAWVPGGNFGQTEDGRTVRERPPRGMAALLVEEVLTASALPGPAARQ